MTSIVAEEEVSILDREIERLNTYSSIYSSKQLFLHTLFEKNDIILLDLLKEIGTQLPSAIFEENGDRASLGEMLIEYQKLNTFFSKYNKGVELKENNITLKKFIEKLLNVDDKSVLSGDNPPDATAWGLHGAIHKLCPHAKCIMHVHSFYATTLASIDECILPPINQVASMFFNRQVVDKNYGGLAFEEEGKRCADLLSDPKKHTFIMGNHGILIFGQNVAETFNRLFYFERAAKIYVQALQTGKTLSILDDVIAEKTAQELENEEYPNPAGTAFLREIKLILDQEKSDYSQ